MSAKARRPGPTVRTRVVDLDGEARLEHEDRLATEEPLEIRLAWAGGAHRLAVTMRTPGHDFELAAGWVVHERVATPATLSGVRYCTDADLTPDQEFNVVTVSLAGPPIGLPEARLVSSACGVCGRDSVEDLLRDVGRVPATAPIAREVLRSLPDRLRDEQPGFDRTGALHAAGLFTAAGEPLVVREDVGRHNAVDKAVGARLLGGGSVGEVLVLSGRVGFELVQKAAVSGIGAVVAVGAPSSLAVDLATRAGIALVGFTRPDRCVVYAGADALGV